MTLPALPAIDSTSWYPWAEGLHNATLVSQDLVGRLRPATYYFTGSSHEAASSSTLGIGVLKLTPFLVPNAVTVDRIGLEVVTAGDVGSVVRLGVYNDTDGVPDTLRFDAGTVPGDAVAAAAQITISQTLDAGICWVGVAVQAVTTTQPTLRTVNQWTPPVPIGSSTAPGANAEWSCYEVTGVSGALPATITTHTPSASAARVFVKTV